MNLLNLLDSELRDIIFLYLYEFGYSDYLILKSNIFVCYICSDTFRCRSLYTKHIKSNDHLYVKKYHFICCLICGDFMTSYKRLVNHADKFRCKRLNYICTICNLPQRYKNRKRHYIKYHDTKLPSIIIPIKNRYYYQL